MWFAYIFSQILACLVIFLIVFWNTTGFNFDEVWNYENHCSKASKIQKKYQILEKCGSLVVSHLYKQM